MYINPNEMNKVLRVTESNVTNLGKRFFEQDRVKVIDFNSKSENDFSLKSLVEEKLVYEVQIKKQNNMLKYKCDCSRNDKRFSPCEHVIAVLFEIFTNSEKYTLDSLNNKNDTNNYSKVKDSYENRTVSKYISYYENLELNSDYEKEEFVKLEPKISLSGLKNSLMSLSVNIGKQKMYNIKDLFSFWEDVMKNQKVSYGKNLEFEHSTDAFVESSKPLLNFILEYLSAYESFNTLSDNSSKLKIYKSKIILKHGLLDKFFKIYEDKIVYFEDYGDVKFVSKDPLFCFEIKKEENGNVCIQNNSDEYYIYYGCNTVYILYQNKLYKCSNKFKVNMLPLLEQFSLKNNDQIMILENETSSFFNFVIPNIKDFSDIDVDEKLLEKYRIDDLGVKVYLDIDDEYNITANVKFIYRDFEFNPFDENVVVKYNRNIIKEKKVKELFEKYHFKIDVKQKYLYLNEEDYIYDFLTNGIELFMNKFEILVTDKLKNKQIIKNKNLNIGVSIKNDLLEIDIDNLGMSESEIREILKRYKNKKKYFRLKDGSFLNINYSSIDTLNKLSENFYITEKELSSGKINVPKYRALALEKILEDDKNITLNKDTSFKNVIKDITFTNFANYDVPENLNGVLREYQKTGFNLLKTLDKYNFGGILADDMGLGKTIQVIALLLDEKNNCNKNNSGNSNNEKTTSIVVCPTSLYLNWENEIKKFAPTLDVLVISGSKQERIKKINNISKYDVVITSYDILKRDIEKYTALNFRFVIADEAQYIKNNNTQNAIAIKKINAKTKFALTGTPIENTVSELWSIFDYCMPGYLYSYKVFKEKFEIPIIRDEDENAKEKLKLLVSPFILRRTKNEVLKELPEKTETVMYNEMEEEQEKIYNAYLADTKLKISEQIKNNEFDKNKIMILSLITRLRQICSHPSLFIDNFKGESSKLNQCIELIDDAIKSGHKILLFSGFTSMFDIITKLLDKKGIKYYMLTGKTNVNKRTEMVEDFNVTDDVKVFLISLKAGGTGLNLIGADMVIHYDPWWNLAVQNQATDRAYRIGQKNNVQVFKLITKNTIEEKMIKLQEKKKGLFDAIISGDKASFNKLTKEEIMELFEM